MNDEKEKWMEEVFQSMKGSQRAKPGPELFAKIEDQISFPKAKVVSMAQWRYAAAAAVLVLFLNTTTLLHYKQLDKVSYENTAVADSYGQALITTYQIYE